MMNLESVYHSSKRNIKGHHRKENILVSLNHRWWHGRSGVTQGENLIFIPFEPVLNDALEGFKQLIIKYLDEIWIICKQNCGC